jgi:hypothetical protein
VLYFRARNGTYKRVPQFPSEGLTGVGGVSNVPIWIACVTFTDFVLRRLDHSVLHTIRQQQDKCYRIQAWLPHAGR